MPKITAIIHAKCLGRIPLKNIKLLDGQPLIAYPIKLAKSIEQINRVIVSTDHPEIRKISLDFGAEVPFVRPRDLSEDVASELVTKHALDWLATEGDMPDIAVTYSGNSFTKPNQLNDAINKLIRNPSLDSVVAIRKAKEFPQWMIGN